MFVYEFWTVLRIQLPKEKEGNDIEIVDFFVIFVTVLLFLYSLYNMLLNSLFAL